MIRLNGFGKKLQNGPCVLIPTWGPLLVIAEVVANDGDLIGEGVGDDSLVSKLCGHFDVFRFVYCNSNMGST